MFIQQKIIVGENLTWVLRCATLKDAIQLSELRLKVDGETENLDRDPGEDLLIAEDFEQIINEDIIVEKNLFLVAEVDDKIVGFARCIGNKLNRFRHKAEFGICISKQYWGHGIGKVLLENILLWADTVGIEKITLYVVETNSKAINLYKRFGFIEEGLLIKDRIHKDGNYYNTVIMGRLKSNII